MANKNEQARLTYKAIVKGMLKDAESKKIQIPMLWKGELVDRAVSEAPTVNGEQLTWKSLADDEVQVEFTMKVNEQYTVEFGKSEKVIAGVVCMGGKPMFGALSAQGVFKLMHKLTGLSVGKLDSMYKAANPTRKDGKAKAPKTMLAEL